MDQVAAWCSGRPWPVRNCVIHELEIPAKWGT